MRKATTTDRIWNSSWESQAPPSPASSAASVSDDGFFLQAGDGPLTEALRSLCDLRRLSSIPAAPVRRSVTIRVWGR